MHVEHLNRNIFCREGGFTMEPLMALDRIGELAEALYMNNDIVYRLQLLAAIEIILRELEEKQGITGKIGRTILELRTHLRAMCGLNEGNGFDDQQEYGWIIRAVDNLKSPLCFGK